jgi:hypothetical protein
MNVTVISVEGSGFIGGNMGELCLDARVSRYGRTRSFCEAIDDSRQGEDNRRDEVAFSGWFLRALCVSG